MGADTGVLCNLAIDMKAYNGRSGNDSVQVEAVRHSTYEVDRRYPVPGVPRRLHISHKLKLFHDTKVEGRTRY